MTKGVRRLAIPLFILCACIPPCSLAGEYGKVTTSQVGPGVYLFTTSPYGDVGLGGNSVAILTDEGVVVYDTSGTPASGEAILAEIRKLTDRPVLYVINSHWHWDHWGGNQAFKAAYSSVQFLSHEKNRELMINIAIPWNAPGLEEVLPDYIAALQKQLSEAEAHHASQADLARRRELLAADEDFLKQKRAVRYTFPNATFSETVTLRLGGREIRALHARAITPGDTYVYLPQEKILLTGDILVTPIPFAIGGSYPQEWIQTLQTLNALDVETIVPGHGEALRGKTALQQHLKLFQRVRNDVKAARANGLGLEQTKATLLEKASSYAAELALPEPRLREFKSYFLEIFIHRAYHELDKPLGDNPTS